MDFTAVGLAVNVAARLCSSARGGKIVIDKYTYDSAKCKCNVKLQTPLLIKGISYPVDTYSVLVGSC